jgi:hypothetical protein
LKKLLIALIVFLFLFACTQSLQTKEKELLSVSLEPGDYLFLEGANQFEGQKLILRVDDFQETDDLYSSGKVKFSLLQGNQVINSHYFNELEYVEEIFPLNESVFISEISINESRNRFSVTVQLLAYIN